MSTILGIHYGIDSSQHDVGACLIKNGNLKYSIEEERLIKIKQARGKLPIFSIKKILELEKIKMKDVDLIVFTGSTFKNGKEIVKKFINHYFGSCPKLLVIDHHLAHLSSAFFHSNFTRSIVLSIDGMGDKTSICIAKADLKKGIKVIEKRLSEDSLGHFYGIITSYLGFNVTEDEYKVMGLAPYGKDVYRNEFKEIYNEDKISGINSNIMKYQTKKLNMNLPFYNNNFLKKFGQNRKLGERITKKHENIAASCQANLENLINSLVNYSVKKTNNFSSNLCLVGGVALNSLANGKINNKNLKKIFVEPSSSDRGLALGCGLYGSFLKDKKVPKIKNLYLGPKYSDKKIEEILLRNKIKYKKVKNPEKHAANKLNKNKVIGWFQGRSEIGPRALGNRSILANPTKKGNKNLVNNMVKFREKFRPFAPSVLQEFSNNIFINDKNLDLSYMTFAIKVKKEWIKKIPATVHFGTSRVQTVNKRQNSKFYNLIKEFYKLTKIPVVLNTSFNLKGQPIVETPNDALGTFYSSGIDCLYLNSYFIEK